MSSSKPASPWGRFIPREEMTSFEAWVPGAFPGSPAAPERGVMAADAASAALAAARASSAVLSAGGLTAPALGVPAAAAAAAAPAEPPPPTEADWLARIEEARRRAYEDGYRDGSAASEARRQQTEARVGLRFAELVASLDAQWDALEPRMAEALAGTAVQLARQVVRSELKTQPGLVARVATEAVQALGLSARHLRLRLHPGDHALVQSGSVDALQSRGVRLVADPSIEAGGCVLESDLARIDARIATRWAQAAAVYGREDAWEPVEPPAAVAAADAADGQAPAAPDAAPDAAPEADA